MNKLLTVALMGLTAVAFTSCSQDEMASSKGSKYKGMVESGIDSRSYNTNKGETGTGEFKWSEGDDIKVWTKRNGFQTMKLQSTDGDIAYYEDNPNITPSDVAVFPVSAAKSYDAASKVATVNYPTAYDYTQRVATEDDQIADDPMVAYFGKGATTFLFHHTGAVIEWDVRVPAGANKFVVTMSKDVTGDFTVTEDAPAAVTNDSTTNNVVTFNFTPATDTQDLYLYMPVPTGEYHISRVAVMKDDAVIKGYDNPKGANERAIKRCKWITVELNMASYKGIIEDASTASKLRQIAELGGIATISSNIDVDSTVFVKSGKTLKVNLNDQTINNTTDLWDKVTGGWSLFSAQGGTLEFDGDGTVQAKADDCYAVDVQDGGKVVINGGHFIGNIHAVYVHTGSAEINGGVFEIQQTFPTAGKEYEFVLNCYDASRKAGTAKIVVKGGTFVGFNPANCKAEGDNTNFVADGYVSVETTYNGKKAWTVKKFEDVESAITTKGATVVLPAGTYSVDDMKNIAEGVTVVGSDNTVLDKGTGVISGLKNVTFKNITINSNDTFESGEQGFSHATGLSFVNCKINGLLFVYSGNFENCTFTQTEKQYNVCAYGQDGDQTMKFTNCTFIGAGKMAKVYGVQTNTKKVYFTKCKFQSTVTNKSAIEINSTTNPFEVYIDKCTLGDNIGNGEHSGIKLYNYDTTANLKVYVDGTLQTLN